MKIIGHQKQRNLLKEMLSSGDLTHALLFAGPAKLGKKTIALDLFSSLFQGRLTNHPDFIFVEPEKKRIQINQIRELNRRLSLKPIRASLSGSVIDKAHSMTREAQNCFLKTLEEPKGRALLILISEHPDFLLPTILSRCEKIKFYPVSQEEISFFLKEKELSGEKIKEITELSLGKPGRVIDFLRDPERLEVRQNKIKELVKISKEPLSLRFQYAKKVSSQENLREVLRLWLFYFQKVLTSCRDKEKLLKTKNILESIQETIFLLSTTNLNRRLALENLVMKF